MLIYLCYGITRAFCSEVVNRKIYIGHPQIRRACLAVIGLTKEVYQNEMGIGTSYQGFSLSGSQLGRISQLCDSFQGSIGMIDSIIVGFPKGT